MRVAVVVALASLTVALAGCGSADVGSGPPSSAGSLTAGALVYWQTVSDPGSAQWQRVDDLLGRFPDGDKWIAELKRKLADEGVSWEQDVKPALGDVVDVAVYPSASGGSPAVVALTNSPDRDKLRALVDKLNAKDGGKQVVMRNVGDWAAISDKESSLDAALKGTSGRSLADDDAFKSGMAKLPDDALTRIYADPAQLVEQAGSMEPQAKQALSMFGLDKLDFAGAWAKAKNEGAELAFSLSGEGAEKLLGATDEYSSALLDKVPADAFAFYTLRGDGLRQQLQQLESSPLLAMGLRQFEREYGIDADEVASLFEGETAIYLRKGSPIPEITILFDSDDPAQAKATVDRLVRVVEPHLEGVQLTTGVVGNVVVLSTARGAIRDLENPTETLGDSPRFKDALEAGGAPDQYTGLLYVDLQDAIDVILGYAGASGEQVPAEVSRNLAPLKTLVAYGAKDGAVVRAHAFVQID
ncbi:MAG TPA: hypothetical protein VFP24_06785 [Gaiellaceae bacterium]|jgi:hypothetical protein|nr:hypothetical protein [Gaiellaceae bacterium]